MKRTHAWLMAATACVGLLAACAATDRSTAWPVRKFQNNYQEFEPKGLGDLLRWRLDAAREGLPRPPQRPTPQVPPDLAFIASNAVARAAMQPTVTWIGHATVLAQLGGLNVLTDPQFSERASPLSFIGPKRQVKPGIALGSLPHVDAVLISHNHYDHLDDASVRALAAQPGGPPTFVVPLGLKAWFAARDIDSVVELAWWGSHRLAGASGPVEIVLTPVQHWSGRGLTDRMATLWGGYAVFAPDQHLYFTGDTGYSKDFGDIRARFAGRQRPQDGGGFDLALIAIGAYEPRWFMSGQHVNPQEAVQIHRDLGARRSMGVHWGTFELTDESLDEPPRALAQARRAQGVDDADFFVTAIGETRRLTPRAASVATR
ncbi:MAG: MBL fold metallo-hydrolase [Burkholderiaceae bacterium]